MNHAALSALAHSLNLPNLDIDYCIIGSAALMLSGLAINSCEDLDILTNSASADKLAVHWQAYLSRTEHIHCHRLFRSQYYRFEFPHGVVEVMGDLEIIRVGEWHSVKVYDTVTYEGLIIPSVTEQQRLLRFFGRPKDIARLDLF